MGVATDDDKAKHAMRNGEDDQHSVSPPPPPQPTPTIDERRHLTSVAALCMCTLTHAYLLISVFPYSGFMAMYLVDGIDEENAGGYAGLIASAFMFGRAFSSYPWGKAADLYGRKPVLRAALVSSALSTVLFGASPNLPCALAARFCLGLSNGMPGTAKTLATELAGGNGALETRGMGLVFSMWGVGFLVSPAIGGWLAEPAVQYPDAAWVKSMEPFLVRFPFLLPNLVGAACCAVSWVGVTCLIEETLPKSHKKGVKLKYICSDLREGLRGLGKRLFKSSKPNEGETMPLLPSKKGYGDNATADLAAASDIDSGSVGEGSNASSRQNYSATQSSASVPDDTPPASIASLWRRKRTRTHLTAYWLYSFVIICIDEAFPLFCMSKGGGLGISEGSIGNILSASGLIFALLQYMFFSAVVDRWGVYHAIKMGCLVSVLLVLVVPVSVPLNATAGPGMVSMSAFIFLSILMAAIRIFSMIFQSSLTIATNNTVPPTHRATMNGLSMLGGSFAKGLGPAFAGLLVSYSLSSGIVDPIFGSVLIFGVIGGLGLAVACYTFCALHKGDTHDLRDASSIRVTENDET